MANSPSQATVPMTHIPRDQIIAGSSRAKSDPRQWYEAKSLARSLHERITLRADQPGGAPVNICSLRGHAVNDHPGSMTPDDKLCSMP
jgi:hypothetical protein